MSRFASGERVLFTRELGFTRHDGTRTLLASQGDTATVLGTFEESRTPLVVLVEMDYPLHAAKVEVPEDYLTAEAV